MVRTSGKHDFYTAQEGAGCGAYRFHKGDRQAVREASRQLWVGSNGWGAEGNEHFSVQLTGEHQHDHEHEHEHELHLETEEAATWAITWPCCVKSGFIDGGMGVLCNV